jgi:short-subunit dehydrogenase
MPQQRRRLATVKPSPSTYALVTGASAGIGQSIAEELAKVTTLTY